MREKGIRERERGHENLRDKGERVETFLRGVAPEAYLIVV